MSAYFSRRTPLFHVFAVLFPLRKRSGFLIILIKMKISKMFLIIILFNFHFILFNFFAYCLISISYRLFLTIACFLSFGLTLV